VLHCKRLGDLPVGDFSSFWPLILANCNCSVRVLSLLAH